MGQREDFLKRRKESKERREAQSASSSFNQDSYMDFQARREALRLQRANDYIGDNRPSYADLDFRTSEDKIRDYKGMQEVYRRTAGKRKENSDNITNPKKAENNYRYNSIAEYDNALKEAELSASEKLDYKRKKATHAMNDTNSAIPVVSELVDLEKKITGPIRNKLDEVFGYNRDTEYNDKERYYEDLKAEKDRFVQEHVWDDYAQQYADYGQDTSKSALNEFLLNQGDMSTWNRMSVDAGYLNQEFEKMTDDEKRMANYIYKTEGSDAFYKYMQDMDVYVSRRDYQKTSQAKENRTGSFGKDALLTAEAYGRNFVGSVQAANEYATTKMDNLFGGDRQINPYSGGMGWVNLANDEVEAVTQDIDEATKDNKALNYFATRAYGDLYSMAGSLGGGFVFGPGYSVLMGTSAGTVAYKEALENGATREDAEHLALLSGAIETAFEYISLENLLNPEKVTAKWIKKALIQAGIEASEEFNTEIANIFANTAVLGTRSDIEKRLAELQAQGYTKEQAESMVKRELEGRVIDAARGGFVSGFFLGGGTNMLYNHQLSKYGAGIDRQALENSLGEDVKNSLKKEYGDNWSSKVSNAEIAAIYLNTMTDLNKVGAKAAQQAATDAIAKKYNVSKEEAARYAKALYDESATNKEKGILDSHFGSVIVEDLTQGEGWVKLARSNESVNQAENAVNDLKASRTTATAKAQQRGFNIAEKTSVNGKDAKITGLKKDGEKLIVVTDQGEVNANDKSVKFSNQDAQLIAMASEFRDGRMANAFVANYKGQDLDTYANDMKLAYAYGSNEGLGINELKKDIPNFNIDSESIINMYEAGVAARNEISNEAKKANEEIRKNYSGEFRKGTFTSDVKVENLNSTERQLYLMAQSFSDMGINVKVIHDTDKNSKNGEYDKKTNTVTINLAARYSKNGDPFDRHYAINTMAHELTHWMEVNAAEEFAALKGMIWEYFDRTGIDKEKLIHDEMKSGISRKAAESEVMARACEDMLSNPDTYAQITANANKSFHEKFKEAVLKVLDKIKDLLNRMMQGYGSNATAATFVRQNQEAFEKFREQWIKTFDEALKFNQALNESLSNKPDSQVDIGNVSVDTETNTAVYSRKFTIAERYAALGYKTYNEAIDDMAKKIAKNLYSKNYTKEELAQTREWLTSEESIASIIMGSEENRMYWDYDADDHYKAVKKNSDYPQGTVDLSNNCPKREIFTSMFDSLQKANPGRIFTAEDIATIRQVLTESHYDVACALCYVEDRRQKIGEIADTYINMYKDALKSKNKVIYKTNSEGERKPLKVTKKQAQEFGLTQGTYFRADDDYIPNQYDLVTYEGFRKLHEEHPSVARAFENYNNSRGMQAARLIEGHAEYKREILKYTPKQIEKINRLGGLRIFSFSDFQVAHLIDIAQVVMDCAVMGVKIQVYTKVPSFAALVKDTNIKMNRSLIPATLTSENAYAYVDGKVVKVKPTKQGIAMYKGKQVLAYDTKEGIDINDKNFLDMFSNPNVGNVCVGISDEQIRMAMLDEFVDYIIPFHSGQSLNVLHQKGIGLWKNYKDEQEDKKLPGNKKKANHINIYDVIEKYHVTNKYEFFDAFIKECAVQKYAPRFERFLNKDANGNYVYTEGYHKLLLDYKMFDQDGNILPQQYVKPDFDSDLINEIFEKDKDRIKGLKFPEEISGKVKEALGGNLYSTKVDSDSIGFYENLLKESNYLDYNTLPSDILLKSKDIQNHNAKFSELGVDIKRLRTGKSLLKAEKREAESLHNLDKLIVYIAAAKEIINDKAVLESYVEEPANSAYAKSIKTDTIKNLQYWQEQYKAEMNSFEDLLESQRNAEALKQTKPDLEVDSEGRILTDDQAKFYGRSQARDEEGNLLQFYHGTPNAQFTAFERSNLGNAYFFTDDRFVAYGYSGTQKDVNPYEVAPIKTFEDLKSRLEPLGYEVSKEDGNIVIFDGRNSYTNKTVKDALEYFIDSLEPDAFGGAFAVYLNAENPLKIDAKGADFNSIETGLFDDDGNEITNTDGLVLYAQSHGYDSIIVDNVFDNGPFDDLDQESKVIAVFNPNQIKSIYNEHPSEDPDIRYSDKLDSDYMDAVKSGNMRRVQYMVNQAAKEAGYNTPMLYHGTPEFGFTRFDTTKNSNLKGIIYTTSDPAVSANYAGRDNYAGMRNINQKYIDNPESTDEIIKNAKTVYGSNYHVMSDKEKTDVLNDYHKKAKAIAQKLDDLYKQEKALPFANSDTDEAISMTNKYSWVKNMFFTIDQYENIEDALKYYTAEEYYKTIKDDVDHYNDFHEEVRNYFIENRKHIIDNGGKDLYDLFVGYELSDAAIDIEYNYLKALNESEDIVINEAGNISYASDLKNATEATHNIGSYMLYGKLGNNPYIIDAQRRSWTNVIAPIIDDDNYGHSTDAIAKKAKELGYSSVVIKNVADGGQTADDYIFFNPEDLKSADPITYDDDGNIIPLSERFSSSMDDIRFSDKVDDEYNELASRYYNIYEEEKKAFSGDVKRLTEAIVKRKVNLEDLNDYKLGLAADALLKEANSTYDRDELIGDLFDTYRYIVEGATYDGNVDWDAMMGRAYDTADKILSKAKAKTAKDGFYSEIIKSLKNTRVHLNDAQIAELKSQYDKDWNKVLFGKIRMVKDPTAISLDSLWHDLSHDYPDIFKQDVSDTDEPLMLIEAINDLNTLAEQNARAEDQMDTVTLAESVYEKFWNIAILDTSIEKAMEARNRNALREQKIKAEHDLNAQKEFYEQKGRIEASKAQAEQYEAVKRAQDQGKQAIADQKLADDIFFTAKERKAIRDRVEKDRQRVRELVAQHKQAMKELTAAKNTERRIAVNQNRAEQKLADSIYYGKLFAKYKEKKAEDMRKYKEYKAKQAEARKEEAQRRAVISDITDMSKTLADWMRENGKKHRVPEPLKRPVGELLNAIDYSSKRLLGLTQGENAYVPTKKDISMGRALERVRDIVARASKGQTSESIDDAFNGYIDFPPQYADDLTEISERVNEIERKTKDGAYVLQAMSLDDLLDLKEIVKVMKHTVSKMNSLISQTNAHSVDYYAQDTINFADENAKELKDRNKAGQIAENAAKYAGGFINFTNGLPYYVFKHMGDGSKYMFSLLQNGWDKFAFNIKSIADFTEELYTDKEVKEWTQDVHDVTVLEVATDEEKAAGKENTERNIKLTTAQIMSLYCLAKREQAKGHILGGGVRIADFKDEWRTISQSKAVTLTESELARITDMLTDRQKEVADELQKFMNTTCSEWGNEVTMKRFGIKAFTEENYFPIKSDTNVLRADVRDDVKSIYALLNMSFTKELVKNANNQIVVDDIFNVFTVHASDMAKYNSLALPVLDVIKWWNYSEKDKRGEQAFTTRGVKTALANAYGNDANKYIRNLLSDLNGAAESGRYDGRFNRMMKRYKIAAVGANLSVALLQPISYARAIYNIDKKYLVKGLAKKPSIDKCKQYAGIALWKSLGFYDTNINMGLDKIIKHADKTGDKLVDLSLKLAEMGDSLTWGYLWNAVEAEISDTRNLAYGSEAFNEAVAERLREILYSTQVVDSTLTRSDIMRAKGLAQPVTAFMSEPTVTVNMMNDARVDFQREASKNGLNSAMRKHGKQVANACEAYILTATLEAVVRSVLDKLRDTDDDETFLETFIAELKDALNPLGKIPFLKDLVSAFQGYTPTRMDTSYAKSIYEAYKAITKVPENGWTYKTTYKLMQAIGQTTGLPLSNAMRELATLWNNTVGRMYPDLQLNK